jgi:hypothetical protein
VGLSVLNRRFGPAHATRSVTVPRRFGATGTSGVTTMRTTGRLAWLLALGVVCWGLDATAQEALRSSLAGQAALDAKKRRIASGGGDIRWGPFQLDLSAGLRVEASDNVRYSAQGAQEDLIFAPNIRFRSLWPVTEKNILSFGAGVGYNAYLQNTDLNYLFITPDSDVSFDVYAGDFVLNFHDRFHYTQDVASQPSVSGRGSYGRFENTVGMLVNWDLNKALMTFNYDHRIYFATEDEFSYTDHNSDLFGLRSAWLVTPTTPLGVEFGFGTTKYDQNVLNDLVHYSAGVYFAMPSGRFSNLRLAAGYVLYEPTSNTSTNRAASRSMDALYAELVLAHQLTRHIAYSVSAGQQMQAGVYAQTLTLLYARTSVQWNVIRGYGLTTSFGYENGEEAGRLDVENFDRFSAGITLSKRLSTKLNTSLGYSFLTRSSDLPGRSYSQNRLVLNLNYSF